jgi:hypothetical protein
MAVIVTNVPPDNSTDASFRIWTKSISDSFITGGWVAGTDTGQINFATVTRPITATASQGYSIFRMNDSLQATAPCFVKLEYGSNGSTGYWAIWYTVGTGTDGAGNLTGIVSSRNAVSITSQSSTPYYSYYSIDTNRVVAHFNSGLQGICMLCVERTHNSDGSDNNIGILYASNYNTAYSGVILTNGPATLATTQWYYCMPSSLTSLAFGSTVFIMPIRTWGQGETSPFLGIMAHYSVDLTPYNPIPIKMWDGITRPARPTGGTVTGVGTSGNIAMRYD